MFRAVGFDMDGTLIDSDIDYERLSNVERDVMLSLGIPEKVFSHIQSEKGMIEAGAEYLQSTGSEIGFRELNDMIDKESNDIELSTLSLSKPYPGVKELLEELKSKGYLIGLLSRGHREYVTETMNKFSLLGYFDAVEAYDDHPVGEQKPNPIAMRYLAKDLGIETKDILYVGDAITDYLCARDSGAGFIGVSQNEHNRRCWDSVKDDVEVLKNISELIGRF